MVGEPGTEEAAGKAVEKTGEETAMKASQKCACWNMGMQNRTLWLFVILTLVILGAGYAVFAAGNASGHGIGTSPAYGELGAVAPAQTPVGTPAPSFADGPGVTPTQANAPAEVQDVYVKALGGANFGKYDKSELVVKKGVPVRLHFTADANAGCGSTLVVYGLNVRVTSRNGQEAVAEFTPQEAGTYDYSCSMRMFGPGKLTVV